jgi:FixJ family two-component response regulator
LLTDVVMTGTSGLELAREAGRLRPRLPIVLISGYADPAGGDGPIEPHRMVSKPFRPVDLQQQIEAALAAARAPAG